MKLTPQSKIFIICPANNSTGGPEALHQLCYKLKSVFHLDAKMLYIKKHPGLNPTPEAYIIYNTEEAEEIIDHKENIIIIPESLTHYVYHYPYAQKIIWWLSVDFYAICMRNRHRGLKFYWNKLVLGKKEEKEYLLENLPDVYHWAQSYRSYLYLLDNGVPESKIKRVCDYMNPLFLQRAVQNISVKEKENIILYNPKKGKKEINNIQRQVTEYQWIPIQKMTPSQVSNLMKRAKLYIDFGYNPGRDRMLRESALMKCIIISGKNGSSRYQEDLNIPEKYKFEYSKEIIPEIVKKIQEAMKNYENHILEFEGYMKETLEEEQNFEKQLDSILERK